MITEGDKLYYLGKKTAQKGSQDAKRRTKRELKVAIQGILDRLDDLVDIAHRPDDSDPDISICIEYSPSFDMIANVSYNVKYGSIDLDRFTKKE